ncbi:MAG TPA: c-type cytochrome [Terriglobales bacterium]|nr:c-type cytochrome [Terriglobales bacterium]
MRAALALLALASVALAQTTPAPAKSPTQPKTAAEQFKNVKVLKDVPADQWFATMAFVAGSLGVGCDHCHVTTAWEKDDKPAKLRAREMMQMVRQINAQNFPDQPNRVTCTTCHNGSTKPARSPAVALAGWTKEYAAATAPRKEAPEAPPTADQVLANYRLAIGGANVARVQTRQYSGTVTSYNARAEGPRSLEQDVLIAGDKVRVEVTEAQGNTLVVYDGRSGWVQTPKESHAMAPAEIENIRTNVLGNLRVDYLPAFTQAVLRGEDKVRGAAVWAVDLTLSDGKTETYLFDQESGLLLLRRATQTSAFGKFPAETWFMDYKDVGGGVRIPLTIITANVSHGIVRRYDEIRVNVPVDMKKFTPPAGATGTGD